MKVELNQTFTFRRKQYGPGTVEVLDEVVKSDALSPAFRAALEAGQVKPQEPKGTSADTDKAPTSDAELVKSARKR